ncbi:MAG: BNR-4 repeat-containing protein [Aristaeellaceae bacterium]
MTPGTKPFAFHGAEKMFYDLRMGPQMIRDGQTLYIAWQANEKEIYADPYIMTCDLQTRSFSAPVQVGRAERYAFDHHLCPVIWMDREGYLHALFNCHGFAGTHRISVRPRDISAWRDGPAICPSISYPHVFVRPDGSVVLYARALGHMGYWYYAVSPDGGYRWSKPVTLVDFDQQPVTDEESWAGSYHTAALSPDGRYLHVGFTYFDERGIWKFVHPRYGRKPSVNTRYHTYYLRLDLEQGRVTNLRGDALTVPLNYRQAEACMVWNSGDYLTMNPCLLVGQRPDDVSFLTVVTGETEWDCTFQYMRYVHGELKITPIAPTNTTWSGCRLYREGEDLVALLICGKTDGSLYTYGAGELEQWRSCDQGDTWRMEKRYVPVEGELYNNPILAEDCANSGVICPGIAAFYGWTGPYSMQPVIDKATDIPIINRGKAYLLIDGAYV